MKIPPKLKRKLRITSKYLCFVRQKQPKLKLKINEKFSLCLYLWINVPIQIVLIGWSLWSWNTWLVIIIIVTIYHPNNIKKNMKPLSNQNIFCKWLTELLNVVEIYFNLNKKNLFCNSGVRISKITCISILVIGVSTCVFTHFLFTTIFQNPLHIMWRSLISIILCLWAQCMRGYHSIITQCTGIFPMSCRN